LVPKITDLSSDRELGLGECGSDGDDVLLGVDGGGGGTEEGPVPVPREGYRSGSEIESLIIKEDSVVVLMSVEGLTGEESITVRIVIVVRVGGVTESG
jgi:hypothetical protein